jgi:hypothetical protein
LGLAAELLQAAEIVQYPEQILQPLLQLVVAEVRVVMVVLPEQLVVLVEAVAQAAAVLAQVPQAKVMLEDLLLQAATILEAAAEVMVPQAVMRPTV